MKPADPSRTLRVKQLTLELRLLQARMNSTIEALCTEVGLEAAHASEQDGARARAFYAPACLHQPEAVSWRDQPENGSSVANGARFYSDRQTGFLQVVQQPLGAGPEAGRAYALLVQAAEFDGTWLSLVFDAQAMFAQVPAGRARLEISAHALAQPLAPLKLRCAWTAGGHPQTRDFELPSNTQQNFLADMGYCVPTDIAQLTLHVIASPAPRCSLELRHLSAVLTVETEAALDPAASPAVDGIFEVAP